MTMIWATRGKAWGFRFLRTGGLADPLPQYEAVFDNLQGLVEGAVPVGAQVGLRLLDPEGRTDRAGRVIPHDFVLFGDLARRVSSVEEGRSEVWPLVEEEYAAVWDGPGPSSR